MKRLLKLRPSGRVIRYLIVGGMNTVIGLGTSWLALFALNHLLPATLQGIAVTQARLTVAASVVVTPLNITLAFLGYKLFVFRTRGNFLREWIKAFGVYGVSSLIGWTLLGVLTRSIEVLLHGHQPLGKGTPGYFAMTLMTAVTTAISYVGHKKVTFGGSPGHDEEVAVESVLPVPRSSTLK